VDQHMSHAGEPGVLAHGSSLDLIAV
jgi:hypothetical protein